MLSLKEIQILSEERVKNRKLCKNCGRSVLIPQGKDKKLCSHCGVYVFKDDVTEFNFRLKQNLLKQKR